MVDSEDRTLAAVLLLLGCEREPFLRRLVVFSRRHTEARPVLWRLPGRVASRRQRSGARCLGHQGSRWAQSPLEVDIVQADLGVELHQLLGVLDLGPDRLGRRVQLGRLLELLQGAFILTHLVVPQNQAPYNPAVGILRLERNGLLNFSDSLGMLVSLEQRKSPVPMTAVVAEAARLFEC